VRIGVDIDDVIYPWCKAAQEACERAGITGGNTITRWDFHEDYGITREQLWEVLEREYRRGMLMVERPIPGSVRALEMVIALGHEVHLVTARGFEPQNAEMVRSDTLWWLSMLEVPHHSVTFTRDKWTVPCDVYLDDSPKHVRALRNRGLHALLIEAPHNGDAHDLDHMRWPSLLDWAAFHRDVHSVQVSEGRYGNG
jgi:hypothetical protein